MPEISDFNAARISLASPQQIRSWSYGEVTKPETINYRTLKPEKDGLFCERIFGPTKDFECACGKYKKIRYKGVKCDRCGVEVARSKVRRERMGHIELACPVSHIWFVKGPPSRLGILLDLSPRSLESVLYFAQYIVTRVDEEARQKVIQQIQDDTVQERERAEELYTQKIEMLQAQLAGELETAQHDTIAKEVSQLQVQLTEEKARLKEELSRKVEEVEGIQPRKLLPESTYRELKRKWGNIFEGGMGAEAILDILQDLDLEELHDRMDKETRSTSGQRRRKAIKTLHVVEAFRSSSNKPEWMILTALPVLPPELRPMVQLDGGRSATSDLNDLYRRVINRNNRLRHLKELGAPSIIIRNEKRMLQEAVDSLINNGRRGRPVTGAGGRPLKSLSDLLKGKQGRFRQNLLGKRVDYSGRSVIIVGPELKPYQCGLPKTMALELFKPFIMCRLIEKGITSNIKSARRMVERAKPEVWDILEEVIKERPILLNRAPTLHRLGIQAFEPVLTDSNAIQIHPLVCSAFNADFDGDQMAIHIPLSKTAVQEAREAMLSTHNMLLPSNGEPVAVPTLDIVLGCYYLTSIKPGAKGEGLLFGSFEEATMAYELNVIDLRAEIEVREQEDGHRIKTSAGRIIFNEALPPELRFLNRVTDKTTLKKIVADCHKLVGNEATATVADALKSLGFKYATKSGTTIAVSDITVPHDKGKILEEAETKVGEAEEQYRCGLITDDERYNGVIRAWTEATDKITDSISHSLSQSPYNGIYMMATSGAKGNIAQIRQMAGMRGLMTDPGGNIIEFPIKSSFRDGLSILEYFISTHGARKGLADTALRTSSSGYLTRRLVDVAQDAVVFEKDCGTTGGIWVSEAPAGGMLPSLSERIIGRLAARRVIDPHSKEVIVERNEEIDEEKAERITSAGITEVYVRSPLSCQAKRGICQYCYGRDLAQGHLINKGMAVGIIAAESIGEPGTQLTLRTFHTGGVVGTDITTGLPRVEELFEARTPKGQAIISEIGGEVEVSQVDGAYSIKIIPELSRDEQPLPPGFEVTVSDGQWVEAGMEMARQNQPTPPETEREQAMIPTPSSILARVTGRAAIENKQITVYYQEEGEREYVVPTVMGIRVRNGDAVEAGDQLTDGPINPQDILHIMGREAVQQHLVNEVQKVYRSQGVSINDKHIETIVRQMLSKVCVDSPGDTKLLPGELIGRFTYEDINAKVLAEGGEPATAQTVLLGITRASLATDSFLSAASFQETTSVLAEAAVAGKTDRLRGLKENVIIGRLIPAHCILPEEAAPTLPPGYSEGEKEEELLIESPT